MSNVYRARMKPRMEKREKRKKKSLHKIVEENFNLPSSGFASICFLKIGDLFVLSRDKFSGLNLGACKLSANEGEECGSSLATNARSISTKDSLPTNKARINVEAPESPLRVLIINNLRR